MNETVDIVLTAIFVLFRFHKNVRIGDILDLWDTLLVQHNNNMTLPAWSDSVFPDQMRPMVEEGFAIYTYTSFMKLVKGAPLVTKIVNQMLKAQSGRSSRTVRIYSGHDLTLLSVIRLLDLTNETTRLPNYGATLSFELHCESDKECNRLEVRVSRKTIWLFYRRAYSFIFQNKNPSNRLYTTSVPMTNNRNNWRSQIAHHRVCSINSLNL